MMAERNHNRGRNGCGDHHNGNHYKRYLASDLIRPRGPRRKQ